MSVSLRPYQAATREKVSACYRSGKRAVLVVSPTGSGKTCIAVDVIERAVAKRRRALFVANRRVLVDQTSQKLDEFGLTDHGVLMAGHYRKRKESPVQVASIQTLTRRSHYPAADLIVVDEAHASTGRSYRILKERYPRAFFLGLSATPFRTDGQGLDVFFDSVVVTATISDLIEQGYLVPPRVYAPSMPDLSGVRIVAGDYSDAGLEKVLNTQQLVGNIVEHWAAHAAGKRTAVFATTVAHSRSLVERFQRIRVPAEHVDASTPARERSRIFGAFQEGGLLVISSVGVISEGWDAPWAEVGVMARPTQSLSLHIQQQGRLLRPFPGKTEALILDHAGNTVRHGFVTDELEYTLEGETVADRATRERPKTRICDNCKLVWPLAATWCTCGRLLGSEAKIPEEKLGALQEVSSVPVRVLAPFMQRAGFWGNIEETRKEKGYKPGWSVFRFHERFGVYPLIVGGRIVDPEHLSAEESDGLWRSIEETRVDKGFKPGWSYWRYRMLTGKNPTVLA